MKKLLVLCVSLSSLPVNASCPWPLFKDTCDPEDPRGSLQGFVVTLGLVVPAAVYIGTMLLPPAAPYRPESPEPQQPERAPKGIAKNPELQRNAMEALGLAPKNKAPQKGRGGKYRARKLTPILESPVTVEESDDSQVRSVVAKASITKE